MGNEVPKKSQREGLARQFFHDMKDPELTMSCYVVILTVFSFGSHPTWRRKKLLRFYKPFNMEKGKAASFLQAIQHGSQKNFFLLSSQPDGSIDSLTKYT